MEQKTTEFKEPGTFPKPGTIGRGIRFIIGLFLLYFFAKTLIGYRSYISLNLPSGLWWIGAIVSFYFLPNVVNIGFTRSWGRWPQVVALLLALAATTFDILQYGKVWGPALGLLIWVLMVFVLGYLGLSLVLAAIMALPG
jgi:hypothetical protein